MVASLAGSEGQADHIAYLTGGEAQCAQSILRAASIKPGQGNKEVGRAEVVFVHAPRLAQG